MLATAAPPAANEHAPCADPFLLTVKAACKNYFCSLFSPHLTLTTQVQFKQVDYSMFSVIAKEVENALRFVVCDQKSKVQFIGIGL